MRVFSHFLPLLLVAPLALANPNGYFIDDDCTDAQKDFIVQSLDNAFSLVAFAQGTVTVPNNQGSNLLQWLFGTVDTQDVVIQSVAQTLGGVSNLNTRRDSVDQLQRNDMRIYCTTKRLKYTTHKGKIKTYDPDIEENLTWSEKFDCASALAYTITPENFIKYNQLQICPWFLGYAMKKNPQFQNQIDPSLLSRLALKVDELVTKLVYTPIDLFGLFDKVMVHEMTHTKAGGRLDDVGGFSGYGWKNARRLSTVRTDVPTKKKGPEKNADSVAILASASAMISRGVTIFDNGKFTEPAATRLKRMLGIANDPGLLHARPLFE